MLEQSISSFFFLFFFLFSCNLKSEENLDEIVITYPTEDNINTFDWETIQSISDNFKKLDFTELLIVRSRLNKIIDG